MSKNVLLIVDSREANTLLKLWKSEGGRLNYTLASYPLDVGDVWVVSSEEPVMVPKKHLLYGVASEADDVVFPPPMGPNVIVVERKALADLQASYGDGRYREQKARLINCEAGRVLLLVEGYEGRRVKQASDKKRLLSTFTHCQFRDNIAVYHTSGVRDSYEWLSHLCGELAAGKLEHCEERHKRAKYTDSVKMAKKANLTPAQGLELQLATIPGISAAMGRSVTAQYGNMGNLCKALASEGADILSELIVPGGKRLGSKRSQRIYEYLM